MPLPHARGLCSKRVLRMLLAGAGVCVSLPMSDARVHAQTVALDGTWRAGATAIDAAVESWGKDCGPAPTSSQSSGGGSVRIEQRGDRVSLIGASRTIHSDGCFSENPSLARTSARREGDTWTTRCTTPKDDPRSESGTYTLKLLATDRLLYQDVSRFRWQLKDSLCVATITTVQTLTRNANGAPPPPTPPALPPSSAQGQPAAVKPPCVPGAPAKLVLTPRRARIELGQRVCLHARLADATGCAVPTPATLRFALEHEPTRRGTLHPNGCFAASDQAAEGEGAFRVIASDGALRAESTIEVVTADLSALVAKRIDLSAGDGGAAEGEASAQGPTEATHAVPTAVPSTLESTSQSATRAMGAATSDRAATSSALTWALLALGLGVVGGLGFWLRGRGRIPALPPEPEPEREPKREMPSASAGMRCPQCGTAYPPGSVFCGNDGSTLVPRRAP